MNEITNIILAAFVGSAFTLIIQWIGKSRQKQHIKDSIRTFLNDVIVPACIDIKKDISNTKDIIKEYGGNDNSLGMFPVFNTTFLNSFQIETLQTVYKKKFIHLIHIIGMINNMQERLPYQYLTNYYKELEDHINEHFEAKKHLFPTKQDHFDKCQELILLRIRFNEQLYNIENIISAIQDECSILESIYNQHSFIHYIFNFIKLK